MTEERRAELEAIHTKHVETGVNTANSVLATVQEYRQKLNPPEYRELLVQIREQIEDLEHGAADSADTYERAKYGVRLNDIDGRFDEPIDARDERTPPWSA